MMRKVTEAAIKSLLSLFQQAAASFSYYICVEKHVSFTKFLEFLGRGVESPAFASVCVFSARKFPCGRAH